MASEVENDESKPPTKQSPVEVDHVAVLNRNIANKKENLTMQIVNIRKLLDEKEKAFIKEITKVHKDKQEEVGNLQEMRSHSIALQKLMSKNPNPIQLGNVNIEDSIAQISDQLTTLTEVEDKWNLDKIEELLMDVNTQTGSDAIDPDAVTQIAAELEDLNNLTKGNETQLGHLSEELGGMVVDDDTGNIYIADMGNNCIQMYSKTGKYLLTISHEILTAPNSVTISGKYVYSCNNKLGECQIKHTLHLATAPCNCRSGNRSCNFYNQFLLKFSKKDGQIISFININASFGLISATNKSIYLYSCGYSQKFTSGINQLTVTVTSDVAESIVSYDEIFQTEKTISLSNGQLPYSVGCLNCSTSCIPVIAVQAFEDEVHLLYRNARINSFNLKTQLRREINLNYITCNVYREISYMCWDGQCNGKLVLTDKRNNQLVIISQLGRFYLSVDVKNKLDEPIPPVAISRGIQMYNAISSNGDKSWMLHRLKLV